MPFEACASLGIGACWAGMLAAMEAALLGRRLRHFRQREQEKRVAVHCEEEGRKGREEASDNLLERKTARLPQVQRPVLVGIPRVQEDLFLDLAKYMDVADLCALETCSKSLKRRCRPSWRTLRQRKFPGVRPVYKVCLRDCKNYMVKYQYCSFVECVYTVPGLVPTTTENGREKYTCVLVDYDKLKLAFTISLKDADNGLYVEVGCETNSVVEFALGSSIAFNPQTGEVLQGNERKQVLTPLRQKHGYVGSIGMYLLKGRIAFIRRSKSVDECTGFVGEIHQNDGEYAVPHLIFRRSSIRARRQIDEFSLFVNQVCAAPPMKVELLDKPQVPCWRTLIVGVSRLIFLFGRHG